MKNEGPDDQDYARFAAEQERTELLLEAFHYLENENQAYLERYNLKYDKMVHTFGKVVEVKPNAMRFFREDIGKVKSVQINQQISDLLHPDDGLQMILGRINRKWHIYFVEMVANKNGETFVEIIDFEEEEEGEDEKDEDPACKTSNRSLH